MRTCVAIVHGHAGSGKTTFTGSFKRWADSNLDVSVEVVNLDPAVLHIPYRPIFDIRDYVTAKEVMERYNLGPNGGIMKAVEESERYLDRLFEAIDEGGYDYVLIDTPGIMEVFVGREIGRRIVDRLAERYAVIGLHIMDSSAVTKASEYIYFKSLYVLSGLRLGIPSVPIWSKADRATEVFARIFEGRWDLREGLSQEPGLYTEAAEKLSEISLELQGAVREVLIDSVSMRGFDTVYDVLHELFCTCGDLT
ncbi:hypothetical protein B6U99_02250 [Candidatus Geothermarchaeota archaeon ex4572_27]|nr:MAG: hypothetical protein B6U99_02250 [Candidatus Geothermarchaeota archaeon ex4572_27]